MRLMYDGQEQPIAPPEWLSDVVPTAWEQPSVWGLAAWQWLGLCVATAMAVLAGVVLGSLVVRLSGTLATHTDSEWDDRLIKVVRGPTRTLIATFAFALGIEALQLTGRPSVEIARLIRIVGILALGWLAVRMVRFVGNVMQERAVDEAERAGAVLKARRVRTQVMVLQRVAIISLWVVACAVVLMQFAVVRSVGVSLLASAGVAGIVLGLAAQKTIGNLLGGIQLSITQPVRIGDTVIIEGEWGQVEEIHLTYLVVRIWDQRRLVIPVAKFLDEPFQNWTRSETELLGTVFFHADYRLPVEEARKAFEAIVDAEACWDRRARGLLVTDANERTLQLRCMMSAKDASDVWTLRCTVREKMVAWLQSHEGGRYLPRHRLETSEHTRLRETEKPKALTS